MKAKLANGAIAKYPYTLRDLKADNRNVMFPADFDDWASFDCVAVTQAAEPAYDAATQTIIPANAPQLVNGAWVDGWIISDLSAEEIAEKAATEAHRADRDALKADNAVAALLKARPAQINSYIDANVTNLAEARAVLKILARAIAVLSHSIMR